MIGYGMKKDLVEMRMTVRNKEIAVGEIEIDGTDRSSLVFIGDTEVMTCSSIFDTPRHSLIMGSQIPVRPVKEPSIFSEKIEGE
jgi:spore germination protein PD